MLNNLKRDKTMLKIIETEEDIDGVIPMKDMKPLDIGVVYDVSSSYHGRYVMRTHSSDHFEVMDLTKSSTDACWVIPNNIPVRLLGEGESITIKLSND